MYPLCGGVVLYTYKHIQERSSKLYAWGFKVCIIKKMSDFTFVSFGTPHMFEYNTYQNFTRVREKFYMSNLHTRNSFEQ